jgi:ADP-ribose pyrophosphatase YjhB (NUDIX family)
VSILDRWEFCPRCGGPLTRGPNHARCAACGETVWANSVPGVQALVERDGCVLLARRAVEPRRGLWDFPGGFLDEHEHPLDGLRRELREETGLEIEVGELLGIWLDPYDGRTILSLTWLARPAGGVECAADDVAELAWFGVDELPPDEQIAFPGQVAALALWRARLREPHRAAYGARHRRD